MPPEPDNRRGRPLAGGLQRVREAAVGLFAKQGYSGTNMKDLGVVLGVQAPSLYNYVDSKQQILDEVVLGYVAALFAAVNEGTSLASDCVERARRGVEEQSRFKLSNYEAMVVAERDWIHLSEPVAQRVEEYQDEIRNLWAEIVTDGVSEGRFVTPSPEIAVEVLLDIAGPRQIRSLAGREGLTESKLAYWFGETAIRLLTSS